LFAAFGERDFGYNLRSRYGNMGVNAAASYGRRLAGKPISLNVSAIAHHLMRLGVLRNRIYEETRLFKKNNDRLCIGNVISIDVLNESTGISSSMITVLEGANGPCLPDYVREKIPTMRVQGSDRVKVFLRRAELRPVDEYRGITIEVVPAKYR